MSRIAKSVGLAVEEKLYKTLGVCPKTKRIFPGLLAEKTTAEIQSVIVQLLVSEGVAKSKAQQAVVDSWLEGDTGRGNAAKSIHPDMRTLFKILKDNKIKASNSGFIYLSVYNNGKNQFPF